MSDHVATPTPSAGKLSADDRDWIRRQARSARALAAEQRRWVLRAASKSPQVPTDRFLRTRP
ncbi:MAG: hypothetical protein H0V22_04215 [Solirubrobacterales bacterium]|jgi:hypothetical protein|nr:hypothetical protein [Solirubrobacterales bacterium]